MRPNNTYLNLLDCTFQNRSVVLAQTKTLDYVNTRFFYQYVNQRDRAWTFEHAIIQIYFLDTGTVKNHFTTFFLFYRLYKKCYQLQPTTIWTCDLNENCKATGQRWRLSNWIMLVLRKASREDDEFKSIRILHIHLISKKSANTVHVRIPITSLLHAIIV